MKLTFLGAARTVTGSQHLIEVSGLKILLDCGLYQGKRAESQRLNSSFAFDPAQIDVLILSHAHIDHSGNIPRLVRLGFKGDIICTPATRDLASLMLQDSAHIQEQDLTYLNKKRAADGLAPLTPLYTQEDALKSLSYFMTLTYNRSLKIAPGLSLSLKEAGHILGSAFIQLDIEEQGEFKRLVFSGDIGRRGRPIIRDPEKPTSAEILILESTYGDRRHEEQFDSENKLKEIINSTYQRSGKIIVPAFAVGRTQELIYSLNCLLKEKAIPPDLPIFVDSPLAIEATAIYRLHPEAWDEETTQFLKQIDSPDPFKYRLVHYTPTQEESKKINDLKGPALIISASGMAETGRILHHLKNNLEDPHTTVLFIGYQAPETLGRRLVDKARSVRIFGEEYRVRARIESISGFSAHADQSELLDWVADIANPPAYTFLVHGEEQAATCLAQLLKEKGWHQILIPQREEGFEL